MCNRKGWNCLQPFCITPLQNICIIVSMLVWDVQFDALLVKQWACWIYICVKLRRTMTTSAGPSAWVIWHCNLLNPYFKNTTKLHSDYVSSHSVSSCWCLLNTSAFPLFLYTRYNIYTWKQTVSGLPTGDSCRLTAACFGPTRTTSTMSLVNFPFSYWSNSSVRVSGLAKALSPGQVSKS